MDQELLMIVVTVEKELTELSNLDPTHIKNYPKDKRQSQDHMVEFYVQDVLNPESSEPSCLRKSRLSRELKK